MKKNITYSEKQTRDFAQKLSKQIDSGVITLKGELGAGKTIFVKGFAKGLGVKNTITSPTFVLVKNYKIPNSVKTLYHIDLYRLENPSSLEQLGLEEIFSNNENIILLEWPERLKSIPEKTVSITINKINSNTRELVVS